MPSLMTTSLHHDHESVNVLSIIHHTLLKLKLDKLNISMYLYFQLVITVLKKGDRILRDTSPLV